MMIASNPYPGVWACPCTIYFPNLYIYFRLPYFPPLGPIARVFHKYMNVCTTLMQQYFCLCPIVNRYESSSAGEQDNKGPIRAHQGELHGGIQESDNVHAGRQAGAASPSRRYLVPSDARTDDSLQHHRCLHVAHTIARHTRRSRRPASARGTWATRRTCTCERATKGHPEWDGQAASISVHFHCFHLISLSYLSPRYFQFLTKTILIKIKKHKYIKIKGLWFFVFSTSL